MSSYFLLKSEASSDLFLGALFCQKDFLNYSMLELVKQGEISITGTTLFESQNQIGKVTMLRFNNPLAYTLTLERYDASSGNTIKLYELTLDAGDTVTDNFMYLLNPGDKLTVTSNIPGTDYYFYGVSYAAS